MVTTLSLLSLAACGTSTPPGPLAEGSSGPPGSTSGSTPGSTAGSTPGSVPGGTLDAAQAEKVIGAYLTAYYRQDLETQFENSSSWAFELGRIQKTALGGDDRPAMAEGSSVQVKVDRVTPSGRMMQVDGKATVTAVRPDDGLSGTGGTHQVTFSDFVFWPTKDRGFVLADFTATSDARYGPLTGKLSDQIGYTSKNTEMAGEVEVTLEDTFRTAGLGSRTVQIDFTFKNKGTAPYTFTGGGLAISYRVDDEPGSAPVGAVHIPTIAPGETTTGYLILNQPKSFATGTPAPPGTLSFSLKDATGKLHNVKMQTPPFPAKFTLR